MTNRTSLRPKEARRITQDCVELLGQITAQVAALQALILRPGASGQVGSSVTLGANAWQQEQLLLLVRLVTYYTQLTEAIEKGSNKLEGADSTVDDNLRSIGRLWQDGTYGWDRA